MDDLFNSLLQIQNTLADELTNFEAGSPIAYTYNPLHYARGTAEQYLSRYGARQGRRILLLGMNPGPWGMAQTGVPFGDVHFVRDWMGLEDDIQQPELMHPKRPVEGFSCGKSEVSGSRLWGWAEQRYHTADAFFDHFFVWNFCPLSFMIDTGANFTPNKLPKEKQLQLFQPCTKALKSIVEVLDFSHLLGVGNFAEKQLKTAFPSKKESPQPYIIGKVLHPSPASPLANRGWAEAAEKQLLEVLNLDTLP